MSSGLSSGYPGLAAGSGLDGPDNGLWSGSPGLAGGNNPNPLYYLLQEDQFFLLQEDGGRIILDIT